MVLSPIDVTGGLKQRSAMNKQFSGISIIVPVTPEDESWSGIAEDLSSIAINCEIVFAGPKPPLSLPSNSMGNGPRHGKDLRRVSWVRTGEGRAQQMNQAARHVRGKYLWFLRANTRISSRCAHHLALAIEQRPAHLHFFELRFRDAKTPLLRLNELGVKMRSLLLKLPLGDQGFCISRTLFESVGGFDEDAGSCEDQRFVWKCQKEHIGLHCIDAAVETSARAYHDDGWLRTTLQYQYATYRHAIPEILRRFGHR